MEQGCGSALAAEQCDKDSDAAITAAVEPQLLGLV